MIGLAIWTIDGIGTSATQTITKLDGATYNIRTDNLTYDAVYADQSTDIVSEGLKAANEQDLANAKALQEWSSVRSKFIVILNDIS